MRIYNNFWDSDEVARQEYSELRRKMAYDDELIQTKYALRAGYQELLFKLADLMEQAKILAKEEAA